MNARHEPIDKLLTGGDLERIAGDLEHLPEAFPRRVNADPEHVERGLAQLVLTLVELLRQLMERQALRRMQELKKHFELEDSDLNINLGPLGNLL